MIAYLTNAISSSDGFVVSFEQREVDLIRTWVDAQPDESLRKPMRDDLQYFMRVAVRVADWLVSNTGNLGSIGELFAAANQQLAEWYPEQP